MRAKISPKSVSVTEKLETLSRKLYLKISLNVKIVFLP